MAVEVKKLGFSGAGVVDNVQVLITAGTLTKERNIPYTTPLSLPKPTGITGSVSRTKVRYADGTYIVNGSISFDLSASSVSLMTKNRMLKRGYQFPVRVYDGEQGYQCSWCYVTSISLTGSVGGLITASVSFVSRGDWIEVTGAGSFIGSEEPLGYWASGNSNVRDWTFNYNQPADPIYLNGDELWPRYIKVGLIDYTLDVTTYDEVLAHNTLLIYSASFSLTGNSRTRSYNFNGTTDLGTFTHSFESSGQPGDGSDAVIIN